MTEYVGAAQLNRLKAMGAAGTRAGTAESVGRATTRSAEWVMGYRARAIVFDLLAGAVAAGLTSAVAYGLRPAAYLVPVVGVALFAPVVWLVFVAIANGYHKRLLGAGTLEYRMLGRATVWLMAATSFASYVTKAELARGFVLFVIPQMLLFSVLGRWWLHQWLSRNRLAGNFLASTVVVGRADSVDSMVKEINRNHNSGMRVVAVCVSSVAGQQEVEGQIAGVPVFGPPEAALQAVLEHHAEVVAVSSHPDLVGQSLRRLGWALEDLGVDLVVSPGIVDVAGPRLMFRPLTGLSLLHVERPMHNGLRALGKVVLDRMLALAIAVAFAPLMLVVAVAIKMDSDGPIFFRQTRVGAHGEMFGMFKFRSMVTDAESRLAALQAQNEGSGPLFKMKEDPRVTRVGRFIRRYSIDELPQLFNVVRGEMSLIGPRPPLPAEVAGYESDAVRRLHVLPGMTGLWQVSGRSDLTWEDSLRLDLWYVDNWSPMLDLQILFRTFRTVLRGSGAY